MTSTITKVRAGTGDDYRKSATRFTVYTDGKARDIADREYFSKHNIAALDFKCASWSRVGGFAARIEAAQATELIEKRFGVKVKIVFSRYAGCSCGCSPGFIGTILGDVDARDVHNNRLSRSTIQVADTLSKEEEASIVEYAAKQAKGLPAEIVKGNAKVASEVAKKLADEQAQRIERTLRRERIERMSREAREEASLEGACL